MTLAQRHSVKASLFIFGGNEPQLENIMKKLIASVLAFSLGTSAAMAGGPVVIVEEPEVVAEKPASGAILPLILIGIALCVALCGGDDDDPVVNTENF